jgi:hypothetical protein
MEKVTNTQSSDGAALSFVPIQIFSIGAASRVRPNSTDSVVRAIVTLMQPKPLSHS